MKNLIRATNLAIKILDSKNLPLETMDTVLNKITLVRKAFKKGLTNEVKAIKMVLTLTQTV